MNSKISKKFLKLIVLFSTSLYLILISIIFCAKLINHQFITIDNTFSYKSNANQTKNILKKLGDEEYSIIFGSSRIQQLSSSIVGEPILNFNYIYARPDSIYNFLKKIDKRYWENVKKVYVFLDFNALSSKKYQVNVDEIFSKTSKSDFFFQTLKLSSLSQVKNSILYLNGILFDNQKIKYNEFGVRITEKKIWSGINPVRLSNQPYTYELAKFVSYIEKLCSEMKREVVFLTPIVSQKYFKQHEHILNEFTSVILKNIKEFYFFYYVKEISDNRKNFRDESHLNIDGMSQWFNINWDEYKITRESLD